MYVIRYCKTVRQGSPKEHIEQFRLWPLIKSRYFIGISWRSCHQRLEDFEYHHQQYLYHQYSLCLSYTQPKTFSLLQQLIQKLINFLSIKIDVMQVSASSSIDSEILASFHTHYYYRKVLLKNYVGWACLRFPIF